MTPSGTNKRAAEEVDSTSTESATHLIGVAMTAGVRSGSDATSASTSQPDRPESLLRRYLEMIRFSHTLFALPFAVLASVWAVAVPRSVSGLSGVEITWRLLGVLLCMVTARSAAMAFNRLVDARIDAANPRTARRHLPAGKLTSGQVWAFWGLMSLAFLASCLLFLPNWLPLVLAIPVLGWICGYSLAKRFTAHAHLWLGIALALSPICAWVAIRGEQVLVGPSDILPACGLALAIALWVTGFDIIYACQDAEFDAQAGLKSIPARFGIAGALRIAAGFHLGMLVVLALLPFLFPQLALSGLYAIGWILVAVLLIRQHLLVSPNDLGRVNIAFFHINAIISFGLSLTAAIDAVWR